jgi:hypothetical protein
MKGEWHLYWVDGGLWVIMGLLACDRSGRNCDLFADRQQLARTYVEAKTLGNALSVNLVAQNWGANPKEMFSMALSVFSFVRIALLADLR